MDAACSLAGRMVFAACAAAAAAGPVTAAAEAAGDPLEQLNRRVLVVNYVADRAVLRPAATAYRALPAFLRDRVRNVLDNLEEPRTAVNQLLQGKPRAAVSDAVRFLVNTTAGVGGLFDPATAAGLDRHDEDFGQTLALWGVPSGPYLEIPAIGPSTVRDGAAKLVDVFLSPTTAIDDFRVRAVIAAVDRVDERSRSRDPAPGELGDDPYAYLRDTHLREREAAVRGVRTRPAPSLRRAQPNEGAEPAPRGRVPAGTRVRRVRNDAVGAGAGCPWIVCVIRDAGFIATSGTRVGPTH